MAKSQRQRKNRVQDAGDKEKKKSERAVRAAVRQQRRDKSYLKEDENFAGFATQLQTIGLTLRDIPGDGNCLFRALGDQLDGHARDHLKHRQDTVQYMLDHREDFEPFVEDDVPFARHVAMLKKPGTYAGNDVIVAFARLHEINVIIHQLNAPLWQVNGATKASSKELHISYHNGDHYSSVRKLGDNSQNPANIRLQITADSHPQKKGKSSFSPAKENWNSYCEGYSDEAANNYNTANGEPSDGDIEQIIQATGCQDIQLIHETLADHDGDVTATIDFLIQIVFASNQSDSYRSSSPESSKADDHQVDSLWSESGTGSRLFGDVHSDSTSQSESTSNHNTGSSGGAIPKSNVSQQRSRSTGRERKRQNKMEKKQRQMERHRQKIMGEKEEGDESDDNDVDPTLLKDLGMLAI